MTYSRADAGLSVESLETVESICVVFEDSLRSGQQPRLEDVIAESPAHLRVSLGAELLLLEREYLAPEQLAALIERHRQNLPQLSDIIDDILARPHTDPCPPRSGEMVGPYRIESLLGSGTFGTIHRALDTRSSMVVAMKTAKPGEFHRKSVDALRQEAELLRRLDHPSIIPLLDTVESEHGLCLVLPLFSATLRDKLGDAPRDARECVRMLLPVIEAIGHAHAQGVVHRDLEPGNILIDDSGRGIVGDFGLALREEQQKHAAGEAAGSAAYMSPEQTRGESHWLDGRADIWAMGVILYELLTGRRPFSARDPQKLREEILYKPVKPLRQINPNCSPQLEQICQKCLMKAADDRYQTADDLAQALKRTSGSDTGHAGWAWALVCAMGLAAASLFVHWQPPETGEHSTETPSADATRQTVDAVTPRKTIVAFTSIDVVRGTKSERDWLPLPDAVPLRAGDKLAISVEFSEPLFPAVYWLDVDGTSRRIFPESKTFADEPIRTVETDLDWLLEGSDSGTVTLLVLGKADIPLYAAELERVAGMLSLWRPQTETLRQIARTDFGRLLRRADRSSAQGDPAFTSTILDNHRMFRRGEFKEFSICRTICIPFVGNTSE